MVLRKIIFILLLPIFGWSQSVDQALKTVTATGTNTYVINEALPATYTPNEKFIVIFTNGNTTACTLQRASLSALPLQFVGAVALTSGAIQPGDRKIVQYNGTYYQILTGGVSVGLSVTSPLAYNSGTGVLSLNTVPVNLGGNGTSTPGIIAGTGISITGSWPFQTINSTGGITNTAANTELMMSNGTNAVPSGIFQRAGNPGDLTFGNSSTSGAKREVAALGNGGGQIDFLFLAQSSAGQFIVDNTGSQAVLRIGSGNTNVQIGVSSITGFKNSSGIPLIIQSPSGIPTNSHGEDLELLGGDGYPTGSTFPGNVILASGLPNLSLTEGAVYVQNRSTGFLSFFNATAVGKQSAVTTTQGLANVLTAYGLLPSSTVSGITAGAWTNIGSFANSWTSYASPNTARYIKNSDGRVFLSGYVTGGSTGSFGGSGGSLPVPGNPPTSVSGQPLNLGLITDLTGRYQGYFGLYYDGSWVITGVNNVVANGTAVLGVGGIVTVSTAFVTAGSIITLTSQADGGTPGFVRVTTKTAGVSFVITSSNASDTSTIGWQITNVLSTTGTNWCVDGLTYTTN